MNRVGVLTGGGDCSGLNPAIRAIVRTAARANWEVLGFLRGWKGLLQNETRPIGADGIDDLIARGGTVLGTSRTNPYKEKDGATRIQRVLETNHLNALIAIGGEDTLGVAAKLFEELKIPIVGVPKTIDNDLDATDFTIGFYSAVQIVTDSIDQLKTTAESHDRVMIVEIMGRHAGWLATYGGIAGGADVILVPEFPMTLTQICEAVELCRKRGKRYAIIAVAEGAKVIAENGHEIAEQSHEAVDAFDHVSLGGIGEVLRDLIKGKTGWDTRSTALGHVQRGGSPAAFDRILGTAYGVRAMELVLKGEFGKMPAHWQGQLTAVPLKAAVGKLKTLSPALYDLAKGFFG